MKKLVLSAAAFVVLGAFAAQAAPRKESPRPTMTRQPVTSTMTEHKGFFAIVPKVGFVIPTGNYGDVSNSGFRFQGAAEYYVRNDWTIGVTTAFAQTNLSNDAKTAAQTALQTQTGNPSATISSWKARTMQYGAYGRHLFATNSPHICPYLSAGMGLYNVKTTASGTGATQAEIDQNTGSGQGQTNFGINMGGGMLFNVTPTVGVMAGMTYHNAFSDPATNYFVFNGGLSFCFNTGR